MPESKNLTETTVRCHYYMNALSVSGTLTRYQIIAIALQALSRLFLLRESQCGTDGQRKYQADDPQHDEVVYL
jgi:hypothetical protein